MILIWNWLFGNKYPNPKLTATDIINLKESGIISHQEARLELGYEDGEDE
jgi:hypothetical protein